MGIFAWLILLISLFLSIQAALSLYLMLYTWGRPERLKESSGPDQFIEPEASFSVLLPARREEKVIYETIQRVWNANYPNDLLELVVICHDSDVDTISEANRAIRKTGTQRVRVETFSGDKVNKPRGLNIGLERTSGSVVTIFDAEDDVDPEIFNVINTVMEGGKRSGEDGRTGENGIVQAGVQLMNFRDYWFSVHNCLEYFFWFKSRLHFHARVGMIPLGGNTVFIRRDLLETVGGWDEDCLTEDADVGIRLSALGEPIKVVYDAQHVTREETPDTLTSFVKQRTRWNQGFLQILKKGAWMELSGILKKLLALYTLSYPFFQGFVTILWAVAIVMVFFVEVPVSVAIASFLPLYALVIQMTITSVGAIVFAKEYGMKCPPQTIASLCLTFIPFQIVLGISAIRAVYREVRQDYTWEKTEHVGAHRRPEIFLTNEYELLLDEAMGHLDADRGSVMILDPDRDVFELTTSRGLPAEVASAQERASDGVAGWVVSEGRPVIMHSSQPDFDLAQRRLGRPELRSSIVMPIDVDDGVTVLSVARSNSDFNSEDLMWLKGRVSTLFFSTTEDFDRRRTA